MTLDTYVKTAEFHNKVCGLFPKATSLPLHKVANLHNPGVEVDIHQAIYGLSKKAYVVRKQWQVISNGLRELENIK